MVTGCSKGDIDDNRVLIDMDSAMIDEVKNFSAYNENELITEIPTEVMTETEMVVETEIETESETEIIELPYSEDYDFSDLIIMQAAFQKYGGISSTDFETFILQDYTEKTRIQTVTTDDIKLCFSAGVNSGTSNHSVEISISSDSAWQDMKAVLLGFDNGVTEDRFERFMSGEYTGEEQAALIGLKNVFITEEDNMVTVLLEKNDVENETVPYWNSDGIMLSDFINTERTDLLLSETGDSFSQILSGIEFSEVKMKEVGLHSYGIRTDSSGNVLSRTIDYNALYETEEGHTYEICLYTDEDEIPVLEINCVRDDVAEDNTIMHLAERIYQYFYNKSLDVSVSLEEPFTDENICIEKTEKGFKLSIR